MTPTPIIREFTCECKNYEDPRGVRRGCAGRHSRRRRQDGLRVAGASYPLASQRPSFFCPTAEPFVFSGCRNLSAFRRFLLIRQLGALPDGQIPRPTPAGPHDRLGLWLTRRPCAIALRAFGVVRWIGRMPSTCRMDTGPPTHQGRQVRRPRTRRKDLLRVPSGRA